MPEGVEAAEVAREASDLQGVDVIAETGRSKLAPVPPARAIILAVANVTPVGTGAMALTAALAKTVQPDKTANCGW
jgi:hypothetical protein